VEADPNHPAAVIFSICRISPQDMQPVSPARNQAAGTARSNGTDLEIEKLKIGKQSIEPRPIQIVAIEFFRLSPPQTTSRHRADATTKTTSRWKLR
jgi:hypothetical protein